MTPSPASAHTAIAPGPDDPLLGCLQLIARHHGQPASSNTLTAGLPLEDSRLTPALFVRAAERAHLTARVVSRPLDAIQALVLPVVLLLADGDACVLMARDEQGQCQITHPFAGARTISSDDLATRYSGRAILVGTRHRYDARSEDSVIPRPHRWFWDTVRLSLPLYAEVGVASLLINLFAVASPLFIMNVYDRVVPNHAVETLWVLAIGITTVFLFDLLMRMLRGYFIDVAGKRSDLVLSATLFERVLGLRMAVRPASVGAFANSLHEFEGFRDFFTSATLTTLIDLPFVLLFVLVIALIGGPLAWVPVAIIPLILLTGLAVQRPLGKLIQELFRHSAQKQATLIESLTGLETIKSMGAEGMTQRRWEQAVGMSGRLGLKVRLLSASAVNVTNLLQQLATVAVVVAGVYLIAEGELTVGALIACTILTGRALAPLGQLAGTLTRYHQARAALHSIDQLMHLPQERPQDRQFLHRPVLRGDIEFRNVHFTYPNQPVETLTGMSFSIKAGEHVAIIGRIGSGKSTIEKLLLGLYEPTQGAILIDGTDARQIDPADLRRNIGYVPQDITLFYGTVRDNIVMGAGQVDDAAILAAAEVAGVHDFVSRHPAGYDLQVGERGEGLSGGQRQSIAVARALLHQAPVLIMDEPSNSMDNTTEEVFKTRLAQWLDQRTLLVVTHRASLLSLVSRIIVVDGGHVVADGPKDQVMEALRQGQIKVTR